MFLARFEPMVTRFGRWKIPKCLENGPLCDQKWVKNGSQMHFSKSDPGPFGMLKQVFLGNFEPEITRFGPWKIPKCLENELFPDQKWVKYGSTTCFSKSDPGPFGMLKQVFLVHFEPNLTQFGPFRHMYAPSCTLRVYLRIPSIRPYTSEYIRQEYFSNTSSILTNTSKCVDYHTQVWVYGIGFMVF